MSNILKLDPNFQPAFDGPKLASELMQKESEFNKRSALGGVCRIALLNGIQIYKNGEK